MAKSAARVQITINPVLEETKNKNARGGLESWSGYTVEMVKKPGFGLFDTVLIQILDMGENLLVTFDRPRRFG